jgi:eukaryotic-like serine/threonine-protein kinase
MNTWIQKLYFLILILLIIPAAQATDGMFRANPQHTGVYPAGTSQPNNVLKWTFDEMSHPITPYAVADGVVYFGSEDHNLYALFAVNGTVKWKFITGSMIYSAPTVANGIVYFGSSDQMIYAVNVTDGSLRWKVHTNSTWDSGIGKSAPAVYGGTVYIVSFDKNLYAINADTGAVRWKYAYIPVGGETGCSPVVANGVVYFGDINYAFYAVNAADGTEKWRYKGTGSHSSSPPPVPVVSGGILYVAGPGPHNLTALDARTGVFRSLISRGYLTNWELLSPAVADGIIYSGGADLNLYAINATSGADIWRFPLGSLLRNSPAISDGIVYAPDMNRILHAIYAANGTEKWQFSPPDNAGLWGAPVIADGVIYIDGGGDRFYAIGNQQPAPRYFTGGVFSGSVGDVNARRLGGISLGLYGSDQAGTPGTLIEHTVTTGTYLMPVPSTSYNYFSIVYDNTIPGAVPAGAQSISGTIKNASWIQFTTPIEGQNISENNFWMTVPVVHGDFSADIHQGPAPLLVTFTDNSTGFPTLWNWVPEYNITEQNGFITCLTAMCSYNYTKPGLYHVQMRVYNAVSHDWVTRIDYINVTAPVVIKPIPGQTNLPTDPDHDGLYEDLSGNGEAGFADVVMFFKNIDWIADNEAVSAFDFNGNGEIGFQDLVILYKEL